MAFQATPFDGAKYTQNRGAIAGQMIQGVTSGIVQGVGAHKQDLKDKADAARDDKILGLKEKELKLKEDEASNSALLNVLYDQIAPDLEGEAKYQNGGYMSAPPKKPSLMDSLSDDGPIEYPTRKKSTPLEPEEEQYNRFNGAEPPQM